MLRPYNCLKEIVLLDLPTYHDRCSHAEGKLEDYVKKAINAGLQVIGLSDHAPLFFAPQDALTPGGFPDGEALSLGELRTRDEQALERIPLQRVGRPREVGYLALYLALAASDYMTGQTLYLDGGITAL